MASNFREHPRKKTVREAWDTPVLRELHKRWGRKYVYFGLPGPEALDVELWKDMIGRVVAFELEREEDTEPRRNIVALGRKLTLLNIPSTVYCGQMEEVIIRREDYDGEKLELSDFVTLFNLDFCGPITEQILTASGRKKCLRFEALREIPSIQRELYRKTGCDKFVMLITVRDHFHCRTMHGFATEKDLPSEVAKHLARVLKQELVPLLVEK